MPKQLQDLVSTWRKWQNPWPATDRCRPSRDGHLRGDQKSCCQWPALLVRYLEISHGNWPIDRGLIMMCLWRIVVLHNYVNYVMHVIDWCITYAMFLHVRQIYLAIIVPGVPSLSPYNAIQIHTHEIIRSYGWHRKTWGFLRPVNYVHPNLGAHSDPHR